MSSVAQSARVINFGVGRQTGSEPGEAIRWLWCAETRSHAKFTSGFDAVFESDRPSLHEQTAEPRRPWAWGGKSPNPLRRLVRKRDVDRRGSGESELRH